MVCSHSGSAPWSSTPRTADAFGGAGLALFLLWRAECGPRAEIGPVPPSPGCEAMRVAICCQATGGKTGAFRAPVEGGVEPGRETYYVDPDLMDLRNKIQRLLRLDAAAVLVSRARSGRAAAAAYTAHRDAGRRGLVFPKSRTASHPSALAALNLRSPRAEAGRCGRANTHNERERDAALGVLGGGAAAGAPAGASKYLDVGFSSSWQKIH